MPVMKKMMMMIVMMTMMKKEKDGKEKERRLIQNVETCQVVDCWYGRFEHVLCGV